MVALAEALGGLDGGAAAEGGSLVHPRLADLIASFIHDLKPGSV